MSRNATRNILAAMAVTVPIISVGMTTGSGILSANKLTEREFKAVCYGENQVNIPCNFLLAIAKAESNLDLKAVSHKDAYGILQITQIGLDEARDYCPTKIEVQKAESLLEVPLKESLIIASCLLSSNSRALLRAGSRPTFGLLAASYNAGITRVLSKVRDNRPLPPETRKYVRKVIGYLIDLIKKDGDSIILRKSRKKGG